MGATDWAEEMAAMSSVRSFGASWVGLTVYVSQRLKFFGKRGPTARNAALFLTSRFKDVLTALSTAY